MQCHVLQVGDDEPEPKRLCVEDTVGAGGSDDEDRMVVDEGSPVVPDGVTH